MFYEKKNGLALLADVDHQGIPPTIIQVYKLVQIDHSH